MKTEYITADQVRTVFPARLADCHKGSFGYVALIGGSIMYSGAIRLAAQALASAANAAMRSGAGVATVAAPRSICPLIAPQILEPTLYPLSDRDGGLVFCEEEFAHLCRRYDCIAFGMGSGLSEETVRTVEYLLRSCTGTLIVDADGLNAMASLDKEMIRSCRARLVLTPHLKEFSRLSAMSIAEAKSDPAAAAKALAEKLNAVVLLKGSTTVIAGPGNGAVLATDRGCPGMATAGSGDVLSGILSALLVNAEDPVLAAAAGAYINGAAGELAQSRRSDVTMISSDTASCIAEVIENILDGGPV